MNNMADFVTWPPGNENMFTDIGLSLIARCLLRLIKFKQSIYKSKMMFKIDMDFFQALPPIHRGLGRNFTNLSRIDPFEFLL